MPRKLPGTCKLPGYANWSDSAGLQWLSEKVTKNSRESGRRLHPVFLMENTLTFFPGPESIPVPLAQVPRYTEGIIPSDTDVFSQHLLKSASPDCGCPGDDMDYGNMISESYAYAKDGLVGNVGTWIMLIILAVLPAIPVIGCVLWMVFTTKGMEQLPNLTTLAAGFGAAFLLAVILSAFYTGYTLKILRGEKPLPAVTGFSTLFVDGIKYLVIQLIYMIPALVVIGITVVPALLAMIPAAMAGEKNPALLGPLVTMMAGILISMIVAFILGLFAIIGVIRFARTGVMGEAFNFSEILATIRKIGWGTYILALIIMAVIVVAVSIVIGLIPIVGGILQFILTPFIGVAYMRYICLLYDSASPPAVPPPPAKP